MALLTDGELKAQLLAGRLLQAVDPRHIKGCTVDLTVGGIYVPGSKADALGSSTKHRTELTLQQGATAVVRTAESFCLDGHHAAVVFPASSVSLKGLLMTNPGHVDPHYNGHIHVTVINMGREPYPLQSGDRLLRAMVFRLDRPTALAVAAGDPLTEELLQRLSPDFLSVNERVDTAAKRAIDASDKRNLLRQAVMPLVVAVVTAVLTYAAGYWSLKDKFEARLAELEASAKASAEAKARLDLLNDRLDLLSRIEALDSEVKSLKQGAKPR